LNAPCLSRCALHPVNAYRRIALRAPSRIYPRSGLECELPSCQHSVVSKPWPMCVHRPRFTDDCGRVNAVIQHVTSSRSSSSSSSCETFRRIAAVLARCPARRTTTPHSLRLTLPLTADPPVNFPVEGCVSARIEARARSQHRGGQNKRRPTA